MKRLAFLCALGVTGNAVASFDLVLVADNTGSSTGPVASKIHRYDGETGVYLGNFNLGLSAIRELAVNQAANEMYALNDSNRIYVVDYNTGALKREFTVTASQMKFHNGVLYRSSSTNLATVNLTTGSLTSVLNWTESITEFGFSNSGRLALFNGTSGNLQGYSSGLVAGTPTVPGAFTGATVRMAPDPGQPNNIALFGGNVSNSTVTAFSVFSMNTSGTFTTFGSGNFNTGYSNNFIDVAAAHYGYWMYGKNGTAANMLYKLPSGITGGTNFILTPQVTAPGPIAVVLAPEPGTFIAIGVGVAALLRRRRR